MLDNIKPLKEIIEPKANKLGISFEEILESMNDDYKLNHFIQQLDNVYYLTTLEGICKSPLFEYSKMINYLFNYFHLNMTKDEYIKFLKKRVLDILQKPNYRTAEEILLINHSDMDICGRSYAFRQNNINKFKSGDLNWDYTDTYKSAELFERNINKIIKDLNIDIKDSKYKVFVIDGDEEYQKYISFFKFNISNRDVYVLNQNHNIGNYCTNNYDLKYVGRHPAISIELLPYSMDEINDKINFIKINYNKIIELDKILQYCVYPEQNNKEIKEVREEWNSHIWEYADKDIKKNHIQNMNYLKLVLNIETTYNFINSSEFKEVNYFLHYSKVFTVERLLSNFNKSGYPKPHQYSNESQKNHLFKLKSKLDSLNSPA